MLTGRLAIWLRITTATVLAVSIGGTTAVAAAAPSAGNSSIAAAATIRSAAGTALTTPGAGTALVSASALVGPNPAYATYVATQTTPVSVTGTSKDPGSKRAARITLYADRSWTRKQGTFKLVVKLGRGATALADKQIVIQQRASKSKPWKTIKKAYTNASGRVTIKELPATRTAEIRAVFRADKKYATAATPALKLTVTPGNTRPLPTCKVADRLTKHATPELWDITLLDRIYKVPRNYVPSDLVPVARAGISGTGKIRKIVIADLKTMAKDAKKAGAPIEVRSAYRSHATQVTTFNKWQRTYGRSRALLVSARPGHSEHQLGTALDFNSAGSPKAPWVGDWGTTKSGAWVARNAWKYGFVMSYPKGKTPKTCYGYEPWHYRYVGKEAAKEIKKRGITLREYLWELQ